MSASRLVIDLRPQATREQRPLTAPYRAVSLEAIEDGLHGLNAANGPLLVVCERGVRSALAAKFLRAEGLDAEHQPGGVDALKGEQEN